MTAFHIVDGNLLILDEEHWQRRSKDPSCQAVFESNQAQNQAEVKLAVRPRTAVILRYMALAFGRTQTGYFEHDSGSGSIRRYPCFSAF
jgi:hypothetical protein